MGELIDLGHLENEAGRLVETAIKSGADACDVVVAHGQSLSVSTREGKTENTDRSEGDGVSLRVFVGNKIASVSANDVADFETLAERAVAMARVSPEDPYQALADKDELMGSGEVQEIAENLDLFDPFIPDASALENFALAAEQAGLEVEGVEKSMGSGASWGVSGFVLATSNGFMGNYRRSRFSGSAAMVAGSGTAMERDYDFGSKVHFEELPDAAFIGRNAGQRAVRRLNPRQVNSCSVPIVFDKRVSNSVLGNLASAINGNSIARKTSFLRDRMGELIANKSVNIIDDPHIVRGSASRPCDGEGVACNRLDLVTDGVLNHWVLDGASGRELGIASNGRASRSGSGTAPSTTNCYICAGDMSFDDMISGISNGLYLAETIGHGVNMVSGDYSKGASGYWIENGEITHPVAEITVAGNLKDMFQNMIPANDLEFKYATNAPTLLVEGMTVGGK